MYKDIRKLKEEIKETEDFLEGQRVSYAQQLINGMGEEMVHDLEHPQTIDPSKEKKILRKRKLAALRENFLGLFK